MIPWRDIQMNKLVDEAKDHKEICIALSILVFIITLVAATIL